MQRRKKKTTVLPGFGITLGLSLTYISLLIAIPLAALILYTTKLTFPELLTVLSDKRVISAFYVSFASAAAASLVAGVFGLVIAWTLSRYRFIGRRLMDAVIDLPFAIPTAVAGISLAVLFSKNGAFGKILEPLGVDVALSKIGIVIALIFIGFPFVVRTLEPVIKALDREVEEAATSLGASAWQRYTRVILPALLPAWLTGIALAFARGIGEYATIIFLSSNMPFQTEIVPLLIVKKLLQFDYAGAAALGTAMLVLSFLLLFIINALQAWAARERSA